MRDDDIFRPSPPPKSSDGGLAADVNTEKDDKHTNPSKRRDGARWERVENEQHPLAGGNNHHQHQQQQQQLDDSDDNNHPFPYRPTPIDTAMLLKSAARSVLDAGGAGSSPASSTASTVNPNNKSTEDDEKSSLWMMDNNNNDMERRPTTAAAAAAAQQQQPMAGASLSSLQTKTLAAMPDEQDKRRFLGCLAAVLAASYDYDVLDEEHDDIHQATRAETALFQDHSSPQQQQQQQQADYDDDDDELDETEHDVPDFENDNGEDHTSLLQPAVSGSFEYSDVGVDSAYLCASSTAAMRSSPPSKSSSSGSVSASLPPRQQHQSKHHQSQQDRIKQQQNKLLQTQRHANKVRLSRSRHLKRRYEVFTRLLLSASDYLMLEKSQAKAFVPMLAKLLVPKPKSAASPADDKKKKKKKPPPGLATTVAPSGGGSASDPTNSAASTSGLNNNDHSEQSRTTASTGAGGPPPPGGQKPPLWRKSSFSPSGTVATATTTLTATTTTNESLQPQETFVERIQEENGKDKEQTEGTFILQREIAEIEHLQPFLESMTKGGAFRCLVLVLLQHLLTSPEGYDARTRHAFKTLGVIILVQDIMETTITTSNSRRHDSVAGATASASTAPPDLVELATRRFESLEHWIAAKLIELSREQEKARQMVVGRRRPSRAASGKQASSSQTTDNSMSFPNRDQIVRGIKVGAMGAAAATLFAVTGGLAAPGIATAAAALAGGTAATAAVATVLTSTTAVVSIFGVGGGTLVAYKMNRRVMGLTEFEFRKEHTNSQSDQQEAKGATHQPLDAELFCTICISGWLRDKCDFQRPWGVTPSNPWITDREELLQRFYAIHRPDHVTKCKKILKSWEGEEKELWNLLRQKYGRDPDTLFPLDEGPRFGGSLTLEQKEVVDQLFVELGCSTANASGKKEQRGHEDKEKQVPTPLERMRVGWKRRGRKSVSEKDDTPNSPRKDRGKVTESKMYLDSLHGPKGPVTTSRHTTTVPASLGVPEGSSVTSSGFESISTSISMQMDAAVDGEPQPAHSQEEESSSSFPKHLATVWDYQATYGGELYTVRWESDLLTELCDSVTDLALELVTGGTAQILKHTALSTLLSAIAWPYALVNAANMIDGTWTLAVERSDEAGRELARSLLFSRAGHRPVTLVGFSFGARTIYSCLKELAKYQEKWTEYRERTNADKNDASSAASWSYTASGTSWADDEGSDDFYKHMREPASIVEDVALLGLPNHLSLSSWRACRQVVSGRLVNCFSQRDLILSLMFQFKRMRLGLKPVCGTCPVAIPGVENIDVSDLVSGHQDYSMVTGAILKRLRFQQPFRSRPTQVIVPEISPEEEGKLADKFDV